jgi:hypothetical protein
LLQLAAETAIETSKKPAGPRKAASSPPFPADTVNTTPAIMALHIAECRTSLLPTRPFSPQSPTFTRRPQLLPRLMFATRGRPRLWPATQSMPAMIPDQLPDPSAARTLTAWSVASGATPTTPIPSPTDPGSPAAAR